MKWLLFLWLGILSAGALGAQTTFPSEPSPSNYCWFNEREPVPLNLDSLKHAIRPPDICAEGKVIVRILLDEHGLYVSHIVLKTPHEHWTAAIEAVLPMFRCTPAIMGGKPVKCWVTIPFLIR